MAAPKTIDHEAIIQLWDKEKLKIHEISEKLNVLRGTVSAVLNRARAKGDQRAHLRYKTYQGLHRDVRDVFTAPMIGKVLKEFEGQTLNQYTINIIASRLMSIGIKNRIPYKGKRGE